VRKEKVQEEEEGAEELNLERSQAENHPLFCQLTMSLHDY